MCSSLVSSSAGLLIRLSLPNVAVCKQPKQRRVADRGDLRETPHGTVLERVGISWRDRIEQTIGKKYAIKCEEGCAGQRSGGVCGDHGIDGMPNELRPYGRAAAGRPNREFQSQGRAGRSPDVQVPRGPGNDLWGRGTTERFRR